MITIIQKKFKKNKLHITITKLKCNTYNKWSLYKLTTQSVVPPYHFVQSNSNYVKVLVNVVFTYYLVPSVCINAV